MIDVMALAREAGLQLNINLKAYPVLHGQMKRFAELVQQATAAECAALITSRHCTEYPESDKEAADMEVALDCADAIRARFDIDKAQPAA